MHVRLRSVPNHPTVVPSDLPHPPQLPVLLGEWEFQAAGWRGVSAIAGRGRGYRQEVRYSAETRVPAHRLVHPQPVGFHGRRHS